MFAHMVICVWDLHVAGHEDIRHVGILISNRFSWEGDSLLNWCKSCMWSYASCLLTGMDERASG